MFVAGKSNPAMSAFLDGGLLNKTLKKSTPSTAVPEKNIKKGKQHQSVSISI